MYGTYGECYEPHSTVHSYQTQQLLVRKVYECGPWVTGVYSKYLLPK